MSRETSGEMHDQPGSNYYDILGVDPGTTPEEIKAAYRELAKLHHPDKNPDDQEQATEAFKKINEAYQILSDPAERSRFDGRYRPREQEPVPEETHTANTEAHTASGGPTRERPHTAPDIHPAWVILEARLQEEIKKRMVSMPPELYKDFAERINATEHRRAWKQFIADHPKDANFYAEKWGEFLAQNPDAADCQSTEDWEHFRDTHPGVSVPPAEYQSIYEILQNPGEETVFDSAPAMAKEVAYVLFTGTEAELQAKLAELMGQDSGMLREALDSLTLQYAGKGYAQLVMLRGMVAELAAIAGWAAVAGADFGLGETAVAAGTAATVLSFAAFRNKKKQAAPQSLGQVRYGELRELNHQALQELISPYEKFGNLVLGPGAGAMADLLPPLQREHLELTLAELAHLGSGESIILEDLNNTLKKMTVIMDSIESKDALDSHAQRERAAGHIMAIREGNWAFSEQLLKISGGSVMARDIVNRLRSMNWMLRGKWNELIPSTGDPLVVMQQAA